MARFKSKTLKLSEFIKMPPQTGFQMREKVVHNSKGNFQIVQVKDLDRAAYRVNSDSLEKIFVPKEKLKFMDKYLLGDSDVLYLSKLNPGAFRFHCEHPGSTIAMAHFYILRPAVDDVNSDYLSWALNQDFMKPFVARSLKGTTLPFVSKEDLVSFEVPVPSLDVQRQIVEIHDLRTKELQLEERLVRAKDKLLMSLVEQIL